MKSTKNYICLVDHYRRASRQRNTAGRYRVGARTPKEAKALLQKAIGFGSVQVYYQDNKVLISQGVCKKEIFHCGKRPYYELVDVSHANAPRCQ